MLNTDEEMIQLHLNRYYFLHIDSEVININDICQLANYNYSKLPLKKLSQSIKMINNE